MRNLLLATVIFAVVFAAIVAKADVSKSALESRLVRSTESFENVVSSPSGRIPRGILANAKGILIFREYGAGFIFGGKGGFGVAMERRPGGQWGSPAFLGMGEGSFGLQVGVQRLDLVFLFMNRDALKVFDQGKFRIGVDVAAAAGPVGANAEAKVGAPVLVYSADAGLYAGAAFEGGVLGPDNEANAGFYDRPGITVREVLRGDRGIQFPGSADMLRRELEDYEAGHYDHDHDHDRM